MKAKIWRKGDPYRVAVWHGELEETAPGQYQLPEHILQAGQSYDWIMYEDELPHSARTLSPDPVDTREVRVREFHSVQWQLHLLIFLAVFFMTIGIADFVSNLVRWLF